MTLYRGCLSGLESGLSWTDDIEIARIYAKQYKDIGQKAHVYKITAKKMNVLSVLHVGGEVLFTDDTFNNLEFIVDTRGLTIEIVE